MLTYREAWHMIEGLCTMWAMEADKNGENSAPFYFFRGKLEYMREHFIEEGESK